MLDDDRCPACRGESLTVVVIGEMVGSRQRRKVTCDDCGMRLYEELPPVVIAPGQVYYVATGAITPDRIQAGVIIPPARCPACGDTLPDGARHCIACGAAVATTGETTRLGSDRGPATGKTTRLDEGAEEWQWTKVQERADFYKRLISTDMPDDVRAYLSGGFEAAYDTAARLADLGAYAEACEVLRRATHLHTSSTTTSRS